MQKVQRSHDRVRDTVLVRRLYAGVHSREGDGLFDSAVFVITLFNLLFGWLIDAVLFVFTGATRSRLVPERRVPDNMPELAQKKGILEHDLIFRWADQKAMKKMRKREGFEVFLGFDEETEKEYRFVNPSGQVLMARKMR